MRALKFVRQKRGLTLRELAKKTGISYSLLQQIESGKRNLTPTNAKILSTIIGHTYEEWIGIAPFEFGESKELTPLGSIKDFLNDIKSDINSIKSFSEFELDKPYLLGWLENIEKMLGLNGE